MFCFILFFPFGLFLMLYHSIHISWDSIIYLNGENFVCRQHFSLCLCLSTCTFLSYKNKRDSSKETVSLFISALVAKEIFFLMF